MKMAVNNKIKQFLSYDNSIMMSNSQQPTVTSALQPLMKCIHPIID